MPRTRVRLDEVWKAVPDYDDAGHMIKVFNGETSSHKGWRVGNIR